MDLQFTQERRVQNPSVEAKRSPESFLNESSFGSISDHRISPEGKWNSKNPGITAIKRGYCNPSVSVQLNVQAYAL
ncbi:hypothetical protein ABEW61_06755 [Paenibacillus amylolyticus]|uniref:hypothetical protein n=1 Tax=Paenibacillus TaxID=44249 RepID=UPI0013FDA648|nr:hypothetical protein [Paenibacillus sp. GM1FR]